MSDHTLYIPDISGFTQFIKTTEISHSKHIIEELITLIIDEVGNKFEVAEIEGDAVFFYSEELYNAAQLIDISKNIYVAFHQHLLNYRYNRICNCGACSSAIDLTLKFIVHRGNISLAQFGKRDAKPFGDAVIAIHRLLKNDIPTDEYVLLSQDIPSDLSVVIDGKGTKFDEDLGKIHYDYLVSTPWKNEIRLDNKKTPDRHLDLEVSGSKILAADAYLVHHFIVDFRYRKLWNIDATEIIYDDDSINQKGTSHYCIVNNKELYFDTIKPEVDDGLAYGEILRNPSPFKHAEIKFYINQEGPKSSKITFYMAVTYKWSIQKLLSRVFAIGLKKRINQSLDAIANGVLNNITSLSEEVSSPNQR